MPSRASNAVLMVDSRADRDIEISLERFCWGRRRLCRNLGRESQGSLASRPGAREARFVVPAKAGTHNHQCWLFTEGVRPIARPIGRGVWVPAFAGPTKFKLRFRT